MAEDASRELTSDEVAAANEGVVKVSMNLPAETVDAVKKLAIDRHTTMTQIVREALGIQQVLQDYVGKDKEAQLVIEKDGQPVRQIIVPSLMSK